MNTRNVVMTCAGLLMLGSVAVLALSESEAVPTPDMIFTPYDGANRSVVSQAVNGPLGMQVRFDKPLLLEGEGDALMLIEIDAGADATTERSSVAMAIVMDVSGSMSGDKISQSRAAAHGLIDRLAEGDVLSLVTFSSSSAARLTNFSIGPDRASAHAVVNSLSAGGGTCIQCGLETAYGLLSDAPTNHQRRVVLLSDGIGNSAAQSLGELARGAYETYRTPTAAIGLGQDVNTQTMSAIAENSTGTYYFMHNSSVMGDILSRELANLSQTAVAGLAIEITPVDGVILGEGTTVGARRDGTSLVLPLGQLYAGEHRELLLPVTLSESLRNAPALGEVISVTAVYTGAEGESYELALAGALIRTDDPSAASAAQNDEVRASWTQVASAASVDEAVTAWHEGRYDDAMAGLRRNRASLSDAAADLDSEALADELEQIDAFIGTLESAPSPESPAAQGAVRFNAGRSQSIRRGEREGDGGYYDNNAYQFEYTQ